MGFAPLTNPGVVVVVTLNGTRGEGGLGAYVAGPTFKVVASEALRVFDVPKDLPEATPNATLVAQNGREDLTTWRSAISARAGPISWKMAMTMLPRRPPSSDRRSHRCPRPPCRPGPRCPTFAA